MLSGANYDETLWDSTHSGAYSFVYYVPELSI